MDPALTDLSGTERKKCNQVHGISSPYSTVNVHVIGDGDMLHFPKVVKWRSSWNGTPHGKVYTYTTRYHCSTRQYSTRRSPTYVCGRYSGIHVWTFHGAQLHKRRWRCGIPLIEFTGFVAFLSFYTVCTLLRLLNSPAHARRGLISQLHDLYTI